MSQTAVKVPALDLRKEYPRSPNDSLGYFVLLPRIIDKCRAEIAGTNGEYNFNCPLDQRFFGFAKIDATAFKAQVAEGKSDDEILAWVKENTKDLTGEAILAWSYTTRWRRPETDEMKAYFEKMRLDFAPNNTRIETWFQVLDADEKRF